MTSVEYKRLHERIGKADRIKDELSRIDERLKWVQANPMSCIVPQLSAWVSDELRHHIGTEIENHLRALLEEQQKRFSEL